MREENAVHNSRSFVIILFNGVSTNVLKKLCTIFKTTKKTEELRMNGVQFSVSRLNLFLCVKSRTRNILIQNPLKFEILKIESEQ